jgi:sialic acid synthase SpsE
VSVSFDKIFSTTETLVSVDSAFSLEPEELKALVEETKSAFLSLGEISYGVQQAEEKSKFFKRSIYVSKDIAVGDVFTNDNLKIIRQL